MDVFMALIAFIAGSLILFVHFKRDNVSGGWKRIALASGASLIMVVVGYFVMTFLNQIQILSISGRFIALVAVPGCVAVWYRLYPQQVEERKKQVTWFLVIYIVFIVVGSLVGRG